MSKVSRNFVAGRMNKVVDERLLPEGEYIDALNIRMGSTENSEIGVIENTIGNKPLTTLVGADNVPLSPEAICIGAIEDSANNKIYWFVHDPSFPSAATGVCDLIVSYDIVTQTLTYHVVSVDDGDGVKSTLNFNKQYLITGVNIVEGRLLFFTDDYNPPRVVNVNKNYGLPVMLVDPPILYEELLVIKKPPVEAPVVVPFATSGQENYMDTRFISFAYRYRYADGEYSATSQWSDISFIPSKFEFSINSMLNEGMSNSCNSANVTYNSGGQLVVGIDLLFKQSANNIIKIIEKIDKAQLGVADNTPYTFTFDSSKIFTILPDAELLRLYDNVPLTAKAQTIMGNRLMYGNYVEGYDLLDAQDSPVMFEYTTKLISEDIGIEEIPTSTSQGAYFINGAVNIADSIVSMDLSGIDLVEGGSVTLSYTFKHSAFSGNTPYPADTTDEIEIDFLFILPTSYSSVFDLATSPEFKAAIGTSLPLGNIKPVYSAVPGAETSCDGNTSTDGLNCAIPNNLNTLTKITSGINASGDAIGIITSPGSSQIGFQLPAMKFVDNVAAPTFSVYEYYEVIFSNAEWQAVASPRSLHSNRDYEVGIVYMDEFGRSSTALVSPYNTIHVPCANSAKKNSIQVTIPPQQVAPYWAKRYKLVVKPSAEFYETVYSNIFFKDPDTGEVWFYLEGENSRKVETGDRLIVKSDSKGATRSCVYATVLEKAAKPSAFITTGNGIDALGGTYMKINPSNFSAEEDENSTISPGMLSVTAPSGGNYAKLDYPVNIEDPGVPGTYIDYDIPAGSRIYIKADWDRPGNPKGDDKACEHRGYLLEKTYTASSDYANFEDWFNGDNIQLTLNTGTSKDNNTELGYIQANGVLTTFLFYICYLQFYRDPSNNKLVLQFGTGKSCTFIKRAYKNYNLSVTITVYRADNNFIFETEPTDSKPDVFFENNLSFAIDDLGQHQGNVQNQNIGGGLPAIVDTGFFNCFAFGNGVESYKVRDSIVGKYFTIGERVNTVSAQNYKRADRFSDITYSGIYNPETNVNKLNEFNLGLLNYKNLEASFGPVYMMDGRETDVLVLQEDKISYVLSGKNLLSDAAAGGAIASIPDVLGTQIARTEKYGISYNPESYTQWGQMRYFTDTKRGAVLMLVGNSSSQDQLVVISEAGMRSWFRDEFNKSFNTQKIGGYDPYMNEYVLHTNNTKIPWTSPCTPCGVSQSLTLPPFEGVDIGTYEYCVNVGPYLGDTTISWTVPPGQDVEFNIDVLCNGTTYSSGFTDTDGSLSFFKNSVSEETITIVITYKAEMSINITQGCPEKIPMTIVEVVLTNNGDAGDTSHIQYRYIYGATVGALQTVPVTFLSGSQPVVSRYNAVSGFVGGAAFPPEGSTFRMYSSQFPADDYVFDPLSDKFKYAITNTYYPNTPVGIQDLLSAATLATPIFGASPTYYGEFNISPQEVYLYLIWDFRDSVPAQLCYEPSANPSAKKDICCDCEPCEDACIRVSVFNPSSDGEAEVLFPFGNIGCGGEDAIFSVSIGALETWEGCITNVGAVDLWTIIQGTPQITTVGCGCDSLLSLDFAIREGEYIPGHSLRMDIYV